MGDEAFPPNQGFDIRLALAQCEHNVLVRVQRRLVPGHHLDRQVDRFAVLGTIDQREAVASPDDMLKTPDTKCRDLPVLLECLRVGANRTAVPESLEKLHGRPDSVVRREKLPLAYCGNEGHRCLVDWFLERRESRRARPRAKEKVVDTSVAGFDCRWRDKSLTRQLPSDRDVRLLQRGLANPPFRLDQTEWPPLVAAKRLQYFPDASRAVGGNEVCIGV